MNLIRRRNFLAGLGLGAGAHILTPMVRPWLREARGQTPNSKRLVLFITGGGQSRSYWPKPATGGGLELSESYAALAPWRNEATFVDAMSDPLDPHLHGNGWSFLTARPGSKGPTGPSIDRYVGQKAGAQAPFTSLSFFQKVHGDLEDAGRSSADGPGASFPDDKDPVKAFQRVFGGGTSPAGNAPAPIATNDGKLLDYIRADATKLRVRLAGPERVKLDQYLESLGALQSQMKVLEKVQVSCSNPTPPDANTIKGLWWRTDAGLKAGIQAWLDLTVNALACGLTNVVAIKIDASGLPFLGAMEINGGGVPAASEQKAIGTHQMWHGAGKNSDHLRYYKYMNGHIAYIWEKLKGLREGTGSVADNTLLLATNTNGGPHHNGGTERYAFLLGTAGAAIKAGKYLSFPKESRPFPGDLYTAIVNAFGINDAKFGDPGLTKGPMPGLL